MGSKNKKKKQAKRQKYIKKNRNRTFQLQKNSHYDRKNVSVCLYGSVCDFVYGFIWGALQFWNNPEYY